MTDPYGRRGRNWVAPGKYADEVKAAKRRHPAGKDRSHLSVVPEFTDHHPPGCECWGCRYVDAHMDDHDDVQIEDI